MEAGGSPQPTHSPTFESVAPTLTKDDVERFGRQMLVEEIGAAHMGEIRRSHVVCVGAGGLGSTILLYLAGAGVGQLTIVDFDDVEVSNLHRQVIHAAANVGRSKAESAKEGCLRLFPAAHVDALAIALTPANAEHLFRSCDVVVDGTDNVAARYLINDAAMRCRRPLVSGSAMGWDGQLSVYGYRGGPCYRCLFPVPPPPATVGSCNDSGVMGPLPGMIGCLQALETLKVITGVGDTLSGRLFVFNGLRFTSRVVKLRGKQPQCTACSMSALENHTPLSELAGTSRPEYVNASCAISSEPLSPTAMCTVQGFASHLNGAAAGATAASASEAANTCVTLDVRARVQYDMAHLPDSVCVPYSVLLQWDRAGTLVTQLFEVLQRYMPSKAEVGEVERRVSGSVVVFVICRRGVNSVKAVKLIQRAVEKAESQESISNNGGDGVAQRAENPLRRFVFKNVEGGLNAYHARVDANFPYY
ncbi:molybdopterin synthase sulfurylase-like protein [Lotmaria passim]